jgi:hypothetical protein
MNKPATIDPIERRPRRRWPVKPTPKVTIRIQPPTPEQLRAFARIVARVLVDEELRHRRDLTSVQGHEKVAPK